jgi:hypothetical protein
LSGVKKLLEIPQWVGIHQGAYVLFKLTMKDIQYWMLNIE